MIVKKGKRVQRESTAVQTGRKMKRTLLCTYFMTLASVVLCCAMFLGTTLAWFTSEVTNAGNVIQVGTLKAMVYHVSPAAAAGEGEEAVTAQETLLNENTDHRVFDGTYKWAPTKVQTQVLKVVNTGDLNFDYQLSLLLTPPTLSAGTEPAGLTAEQLQQLLKSFELYVYNGQTDTVPAEDNITLTEDEWIPLGTLEGFLTTVTHEDGTAELALQELNVFNGTLIPNVTLSEGEPTTGSVQYITVAIRMADAVDTSLMGQSFTISVKLSATQTIAE